MPLNLPHWSLFNLRASVLLLKARWSEHWNVWPVYQEAPVFACHWVCCCLAGLLWTAGPTQSVEPCLQQRWCCVIAPVPCTSCGRAWALHSHVGNTDVCGVLLRYSSNGREAASWGAAHLSHTLCQKWLLCWYLRPLFWAWLTSPDSAEDVTVLTGRPLIRSSQSIREGVIQLNLLMAVTRISMPSPQKIPWPLCKLACLFSEYRSALNRSTDGAHLQQATSGPTGPFCQVAGGLTLT